MQEPSAPDPDERRASAESWEDAASGWIRQRELMRAFAEPVAHWLVEAVSPQPGHRLLELAAGLGETGLLAAELVLPGGEVIISDQSEAMLAGARERARELGVSNVDFKRLDAEWIDLPVASIDGVICRWALMLLVDPSAALGEIRRVLKPGGRVALAVWDPPEHNPWLVVPGQLLVARGLAERPDPAERGPFALSDHHRLTELIEDAGFTEVTLEALDLTRRHPSFETYWEAHLDLSRKFQDAIMSRTEAEIAGLRAALEERLEPYRQADGSLAMPARALLATASA
jgi:ubiquinone/menaquinone biosynthesis C-methylase UbiE